MDLDEQQALRLLAVPMWIELDEARWCDPVEFRA